MNTLSVNIYVFTDPASAWCWGSEPVLRKIETYYKDRVELKFVMGGLIRDIRKFYDAKNQIGRDISLSNKNLSKHWLEASKKHGMPVQTEGIVLFSEDYPSTYPLNKGYKAAELQDAGLARKFLRRMQEAIAVDAIPVIRLEKMVILAEETGLNVELFIEHMADGPAEQAFQKDLQKVKEYGVRVFPTFLIQYGKKETILRGFQPFERIKKAIDTITNGEVTGEQERATDKNILSFIKQYGRVAPVEIKESFDLKESKLEDVLQRLEAQKLVVIIPAGNGAFVTEASHPSVVDLNQTRG